MNHEIGKVLGREGVVQLVITQRLRWYGHLLRQEELSVLKLCCHNVDLSVFRIMSKKPQRVRQRGGQK